MAAWNDGLDPTHAATHPITIGNGTYVGSKGRVKQVKAGDFILQIPQNSNQGLAEVPGLPVTNPS